MAVDLNHGVVQGRVVSLNTTDSNTRVTIVSNDDYRKGDEWIQRPYFLQVSYFGSLGENLANKVNKGDIVTLEFKIGSYKPRDSEYHTLSLNGTAFHLVPGANQTQDAKPKTNNSNRKKNDRTSKRSTVDEDDWDSLPPWDDDDN